MYFSLDGLSLIFHLKGGIWKHNSLLIYNVTVLVPRRLCVLISPKELGRSPARCSLLSQAAIVYVGISWGSGVGFGRPEGCQEHIPVDGMCVLREGMLKETRL